MSDELLPESVNRAVNGLVVEVALEAVQADETVSGEPRQGVAVLGSLGDIEAGIWELREGVVTDTEVDELFTVLSGEATIEFLTADGEVDASAGEPVTVSAGDVMRLVAGSRTRWTVADHIRKVYLTAE